MGKNDAPLSNDTWHTIKGIALGAGVNGKTLDAIMQQRFFTDRRNARKALQRKGLWRDENGAFLPPKTTAVGEKRSRPSYPLANNTSPEDIAKRRKRAVAIYKALERKCNEEEVVSITDVVMEYLLKHKEDWSYETIRRDLASDGIVACRTGRAPGMEKHHALGRLKECKALRRQFPEPEAGEEDPLQEHGKRMIFTDETGFKAVHRKRCGLKPLNPDGTKPRIAIPQDTGDDRVKLMIFGAISYGCRPLICICPEAGSGPKGGYAHGDYLRDLHHRFVPWVRKHPRFNTEVVFEEDSCGVHGKVDGPVAEKIDKWFDGTRVQVPKPMTTKERQETDDCDIKTAYIPGCPEDVRKVLKRWKLPTKGADLSPVENYWSWLKRRVGCVRNSTRDEWIAKVEREARATPQKLIDSLCGTWHHRIDACIEKEGWATRY